ncbi:hypothetical protein H0G86_009879 [Trichoderma simmonsii]|uniref:C2H2-type domain-containing protein n=1 Tax=Trichoderma simmonsii TaxID=1491479 RepID=A0A8G0LNM9_9HYPO|nr:hypothetical protein H0G86_009879 [Trichoderma simmonsii]
MMDKDETLDAKKPTIAICATQCLESFRQCVLRASPIHPRELSVVEDQVARLSTWAASIGIFSPGRASIDHRLRYAPEVQSVVTGLLESLDFRIRACSDVLDTLGKFGPLDARSSANEQLEQCFVDIATEISRLDKISSTVHRGTAEVQVLLVSDYQITDDNGNSVEPLLLNHFENHIGSRFPHSSKTIQQRLARAMLLRQKQILYRRYHKVNTAVRSQKAVPMASIALSAARSGLSPGNHDAKQDNSPITVVAGTTITSTQIQNTTTSPSDNFRIVFSSPFVISAIKTASLGNHEELIFPPAPGLATKRKYEQLKSDRLADFHNVLLLGEAISDAESKLNELLKSDLQAIKEITCPYCLHALPAQEIFDEQKWNNHVETDLHPFVCLFDNCTEADLLYNHTDEWLSHMHLHSKLWRCSSHRELGPFSTREDYIKHIQEVHNTNLSDIQLRALAKQNTRRAIKLFSLCPMCGKDMTEVDGHMEDHITKHLIFLALNSLPSYEDDILDNTREEKDTIGAPQPQSKSTVLRTTKGKDTLEYGPDNIKKERLNTSLTPFKRPKSQSLDRSLNTSPHAISSSTPKALAIPSLSSMLSDRRLSAEQIPLRPRSPSHLVTGRTGISTINVGNRFPEKQRRRPMRDLSRAGRKEQTVCIGCKMAKVMCEGREVGRDCVRCSSRTSISSGPPMPFMCEPASFFRLVQQGSTALLGLHVIYPLNTNGFRQPIELPLDINIEHLLGLINKLQNDYDIIRIHGPRGIRYELDLHACWVYINSNCSPIIHRFQPLINGLTIQRHDTWKACIKNPDSQPLNSESLCETLLAMDDMAPWFTYTLRPKPNNEKTNVTLLTTLAPENTYERQIIILTAQLSRIIGRKIELQFYQQLEEALANSAISRELVLDVGYMLMSLRRRLTQWKYHWERVSPNRESDDELEDKKDQSSNPIIHIQQLCKILYVYFCYMRRRLPPYKRKDIETMIVWYPDIEGEVQETFPKYESEEGFEDWLHFNDSLDSNALESDLL